MPRKEARITVTVDITDEHPAKDGVMGRTEQVDKSGFNEGMELKG